MASVVSLLEKPRKVSQIPLRLVGAVIALPIVLVSLHHLEKVMRSQPGGEPAGALVVDYDRPLDEAAKQGRYTSVDSRIFSLSRSEKRGKKEVKFRLYQWKEEVSTEEVLRKMRADNCRPADLLEIFAWSEASKEIKGAFVALGQSLTRRRGQFVPRLSILPGGQREIFLWPQNGKWTQEGEERWSSPTSFLAVDL